MTIIEPVCKRLPFFDGWETSKAHFAFSCHLCGAKSAISFKDMLQAAWGWKENTEPQLRSSVASHFGIDLNDKYIGDGMDTVVVSKCANCSRKTYIYFWFHEYQNSCYQISLLGLAHNDI